MLSTRFTHPELSSFCYEFIEEDVGMPVMPCHDQGCMRWQVTLLFSIAAVKFSAGFTG